MINKSLLTKNYVIRDFINEDFDGIRAWLNDKEVTRFLVDSFIFDHFYSENETEEFLQSTFTGDMANIKLVALLI